MDKDQKDLEIFKHHLDKKYSLFRFRFQITRQLNKAILTIASGALILSITLIKDIFKQPKSSCLFEWSLYLWIFTIILTLFASWHDTFALKKQEDIEDDWHTKYEKSNYENWPNYKENPYDTCTKILNSLIAISFVLALILLIAFFKQNFS